MKLYAVKLIVYLDAEDELEAVRNSKEIADELGETTGHRTNIIDMVQHTYDLQAKPVNIAENLHRLFVETEKNT